MSYYYSNYITELSVQDLSKNLNERMRENRNFDHYNQINKLSADIVYEDSSFFTSFEKTINEIDERLVILNGYKPITDTDGTVKDGNECNVGYKNFAKNENFDNFPDLTRAQIRKLNILKKELDLTETINLANYINKSLHATNDYIKSNTACLINDEFYINVFPKK